MGSAKAGKAGGGGAASKDEVAALQERLDACGITDEAKKVRFTACGEPVAEPVVRSGEPV
jgi:hypothetical protein